MYQSGEYGSNTEWRMKPYIKKIKFIEKYPLIDTNTNSYFAKRNYRGKELWPDMNINIKFGEH